jgi:hypothetical protein
MTPERCSNVPPSIEIPGITGAWPMLLDSLFLYNPLKKSSFEGRGTGGLLTACSRVNPEINRVLELTSFSLKIERGNNTLGIVFAFFFIPQCMLRKCFFKE